MKDFEGYALEVGMTVVFAYTRAKNTTLKRGVITKVGIKQANMVMAEIEHSGGSKNRVIGHKITRI